MNYRAVERQTHDNRDLSWLITTFTSRETHSMLGSSACYFPYKCRVNGVRVYYDSTLTPGRHNTMMLSWIRIGLLYHTDF